MNKKHSYPRRFFVWVWKINLGLWVGLLILHVGGFYQPSSFSADPLFAKFLYFVSTSMIGAVLLSGAPENR